MQAEKCGRWECKVERLKERVNIPLGLALSGSLLCYRSNDEPNNSLGI